MQTLSVAGWCLDFWTTQSLLQKTLIFIF